MRVAFSILGTEVFALDYGDPPEREAPEPGPPLGFSGGPGGYADIAYDDPEAPSVHTGE